MIHKIHGELIFDEWDMVTCRFERVTRYPVARVWKHLTDRRHLHEWLTSEPGGVMRPRPGGEVYLPTVGGAVIRSEVIYCEPEEYLSIGWETADWLGGAVSWALTPQAGETAIVFEHAEDVLGQSHIIRTMSNWHMTLDRFEASLAGQPEPWNWDGWQEYVRHYERVLPYAERQ